jgi:hypothetical protein
VSKRLTANQSSVIIVLRHLGPQTDRELVSSYGDLMRNDIWSRRLSQQSESGIRTRRKELVELGFVEECGKKVDAGGRRHTIWRALDTREVAARQGTTKRIIMEVEQEAKRRRTEGTLFDPGPERGSHEP